MVATLQLQDGPQPLADLAQALAAFVNRSKSRVPADRVQPAGGDGISQAAAARLSKQVAQLAKLNDDGLIKLHRGAHAIGASANLYSRADPEAAEAIARAYGGRRTNVGSIIPNPVASDAGIGAREVPTESTAIPQGSDLGDAEDFAGALESGGDRGESARTIVSKLMEYVQDPDLWPATTVDGTQTRLQNWRPVGTEVATLFKNFRVWLDKVKDKIEAVVRSVEEYEIAYQRVQVAHQLRDQADRAIPAQRRRHRGRDAGSRRPARRCAGGVEPRW